MHCKEIRELLSEHIDEVLAPEREAELQKHLAECEECRAELAALKETVTMIGSISELEPPTDLLERVHTGIEEDKRERESRLWIVLRMPIVRAALAASLLVVVGYFGIRTVSESDRHTMPSELADEVVIEQDAPEIPIYAEEGAPEIRLSFDASELEAPAPKPMPVASPAPPPARTVRRSRKIQAYAKAPAGAAPAASEMSVPPSYTLTVETLDPDSLIREIERIAEISEDITRDERRRELTVLIDGEKHSKLQGIIGEHRAVTGTRGSLSLKGESSLESDGELIQVKITVESK